MANKTKPPISHLSSIPSISISAPVITVDGTSGSGKGTISRLLAQKLHWHYLDSGVLYRVLAFALMQSHPESKNITHKIAIEKSAAKLAKTLAVECRSHQDKSVQVIFEGQDITVPIRTSMCASIASQISALPLVRHALLARQRAFCQPPGLVADGRDMGTIVFPQAAFKIFMTASLEARAKRRYRELQEKNINDSLERVLTELSVRDKRDAERTTAPLKPALSAWALDTTYLTIDEAFDLVCQRVSKVYTV